MANWADFGSGPDRVLNEAAILDNAVAILRRVDLVGETEYVKGVLVAKPRKEIYGRVYMPVLA